MTAHFLSAARSRRNVCPGLERAATALWIERPGSTVRQAGGARGYGGRSAWR